MQIIKRLLLFILLSCGLWSCTREVQEVIPVDDFFKIQEKILYKLSFDGKYLSYLKVVDNRQELFLEDISTGKLDRLTHSQGSRSVTFYVWISDTDVILFEDDTQKTNVSAVYILNVETGKTRPLSVNQKSRIKIIDEQLIDNKYLMVSSNQRDSSVFDVYKLNIQTGNMERTATNPGNVSSWLLDKFGNLRVAISNDGVNETLMYRKHISESFKPILTNNFQSNVRPIAFVDSTSDDVYAISNVNRDKSAFVILDMKSGEEKKVLYANDTVNVIDAQFSRARKKITFLVAETWKREKIYLDDSIKAFYHRIDAHLPNTETRIVSRDRDEKTYIVRTFIDKNPGAYYIYFAKTDQIRKIEDVNPVLNEEVLSDMRPISYKSRDGLNLQGYLMLPKNKKPYNLPVVVMPHDGPGSRSIWGYIIEGQFLANRGYAVLFVNYRGSEGFGKNFFAAGFKQWDHKILEDVNDGVSWLINQKIAHPKKVAIYGTGLGGFIALNCLYKYPDIYSCGGANSGVLNLFSYLKSIPPYMQSNLKMYYEIIGDPKADAEYLRKASPVFHADQFKAPVFIAQNTRDPQGNNAETVQFIKELKKNGVKVTYVEKEEGPSNFQRQTGRRVLYKALETFLSDNIDRK